MELHILTLSWNGKDKLQELYPTLKKSLKQINIPAFWHIKDNGSVDGSIDLINSWNDSMVNGIQYPHNTDSFAYGCNYLFQQANPKDEDLVLLLNNDIVFKDNVSLKHMIDLFNDDSVGLVGAKTVFKDSGKIQHAGVIFNPRLGLPIHFGANEQDSDLYSTNREFQAVTGAIWLTKAKYYKNICTTNKSKICGMPESFIWMFEDISAGLSIKYDMNKKVVCCGKTNIMHDESSSLKKNPMNKLFAQKNINTFLNLWKGRYIVDQNLYSNNKYNIYK